MSIEADVIVVGAGPAGSATATHLARRGLQRGAAGEGDVPAGEGVRRRAHAAGHPPVDPARASTPASRPAGCTTGGCGSTAASGPSSSTGPISPTSRRTGWSGPAPTSTTCWPATPSRPAPSCTSCATSPHRSSTPGPSGSSACRPGTAASSARRGGGRRRQLHPAEPGHGPEPSATTGRWAWRCAPTTAARGTATTTWSPGWSCGTASRGQSNLLPGYGWIFGMGDGTCNVGLGHPQHLRRRSAGPTTRTCCKRWLDNTPEEWGFRDENMTTPGPRRGAADGLQPHSRTTPAACCWSATPAAWSTRSTARASRTRWSPASSPPTRIAEAHYRGVGHRRRAERALESYPVQLKAELGGYYTLGRAFVKLIGNPQVMHACTKYGLPRKTLMRFTLKLLANLHRQPGRGRDGQDHQLAAARSRRRA